MGQVIVLYRISIIEYRSIYFPLKKDFTEKDHHTRQELEPEGSSSTVGSNSDASTAYEGNNFLKGDT